jgi:hypothetical protein
MKLSDRTLEGLAEMVTGDNGLFPYRSGSRIVQFFHRAGFPFTEPMHTRKWWAKERLVELDLGASYTPDLPSDDLLRVISEVFDIMDFEKDKKDITQALGALNTLLKREGLASYLDDAGRCHLRNTGTGANSSILPQKGRPLSTDEIEQRQKLSGFLDSASEDEFTERLLVPFFQRLGFYRVSAAGHKEKTLEFGKDLWMKYQLPTGHWIYFGAQIKRDKLDSAGASGGKNVATILNQAEMAIGHAIFDPDANQKVLLDHLFIISAGEITRAAKTWLGERLDASQRRHIIFMDRDEFLDHSARIMIDLKIDAPQVKESDIPF